MRHNRAMDNDAQPGLARTTGLYPSIEPRRSGWLDALDGHRVYWEESGVAAGVPVLFLHGGPGSASQPGHRRFFDPTRYRIVLLDQRGCGRSEPHGERDANNTPALIADLERLREALGIDGWLLFGGSWGASLALAYAACHPARCRGLVLRGSFLTGAPDLDWFFDGAAALVPDAFERLVDAAGQPDRTGLLPALAAALEDPDRAVSTAAAWLAWESALMRFGAAPPMPAISVDAAAVRRCRLQAAYLLRSCDLGEAALLDGCAALADKPAAIVHGRLDLVCRPRNALLLHRALRRSRLRLIERAGHDAFEPAIAGALVEACDAFARNGHFDDWGLQ